MKSWVIGEQNPYSESQRYSLYPEPPHASGARLARILGLTAEEYLDRFNRWNLLLRSDGAWSKRKASIAALGVTAYSGEAPVVLLGAKVAQAFGFGYAPFTVEGRFALLPHPSGLNRIWNSSGAVESARDCVRAAGVSL